jgi:DNA-binding MarR family transcriptional regulator
MRGSEQGERSGERRPAPGGRRELGEPPEQGAARGQGAAREPGATQSTRSEPDRDDLGQTLRSGVGRFYRRYRAERRSDELGDAALDVLAVVCKEGPATLTWLSEHQRVTPPTMSQTVNRLVDAGCLERRRDPSDGRKVLFAATPAGAALNAEVRGASLAWLDARLAELTDEERAILGRAGTLLQRIAER